MLILLTALSFAADPLTLQVKGLLSEEGQVICTVYLEPKTWLKKKGYAASVKAEPAAGEATCLFDGLPAGTYAAVFLHDVDGDGAMTSTWLGMPAEPWGVSLDAPMRFGPPSFEESSFSHPGAVVVATAK